MSDRIILKGILRDRRAARARLEKQLRRLPVNSEEGHILRMRIGALDSDIRTLSKKR